METAIFFLNQWICIQNTYKAMSTIDPKTLVKGDSDCVDIFIEKTQELVRDLKENGALLYNNPNSTLGKGLLLCLRYQHSSTTQTVDRFLSNFVKVHVGTLNTHQFFAYNCIPETNMYHGHEVEVVVDLIIKVMKYGLLSHIRSVLTERQLFVQEDAERIDSLLDYATTLSSYPCIPDNLIGNVRVTNQAAEISDKDIGTPGSDSICHLKNISDVRVCVLCKLLCAVVGLTDVKEQDSKLLCECCAIRGPKTSFSLMEKSTLVRATHIVRSLLLTRKHIPSGIGCTCKHHQLLLKGRMSAIRAGLDKVNFFSGWPSLRN